MLQKKEDGSGEIRENHLIVDSNIKVLCQTLDYHSLTYISRTG